MATIRTPTKKGCTQPNGEDTDGYRYMESQMEKGKQKVSTTDEYDSLCLYVNSRLWRCKIRTAVGIESSIDEASAVKRCAIDSNVALVINNVRGSGRV